MANEVAAKQPQFTDLLRNELISQSSALPRDLNIERFVQNAKALLNGNDVLFKFAKTHGTSQIISGLMRGAFLGLDAFNKEFFLIPYKDVLNFMPSYTGMQKLCMKYSTREIKTLYAKVVREGDEFSEEIVNGEPSITFRPQPFNTKKIVGAFAVCLYKDGGMIYETMSLEELEQCRRSSQAKNSPAWQNFTQMMYRKTVLKRISGNIPLDMDEKLSDALVAGLEIETDPAKIAEQQIRDNGNSEELVIDATEVTT